MIWPTSSLANRKANSFGKKANRRSTIGFPSNATTSTKCKRDWSNDRRNVLGYPGWDQRVFKRGTILSRPGGKLDRGFAMDCYFRSNPNRLRSLAAVERTETGQAVELTRPDIRAVFAKRLPIALKIAIEFVGVPRACSHDC